MSFPGSPYVTGVSPVLEMNVLMRQGAYEAQYISLTGVSQSYLKQLNLGEGRIPAPGKMGMVFGNGVLQRFTKRENRKRLLGLRENAGCGSYGKADLCGF